MIVRPNPSHPHPRPQARRESVFSLNGLWDYAITKDAAPPKAYDGRILVPYSPESEASGVKRQLKADEYFHYRLRFSLPSHFSYERLLLHIDACDQICTVFFNGVEVMRHEGGYLPFVAEITPLEGENEITLLVTDNASSDVYARGKQKYERGGIWYTAISGIWQSVWLEGVPKDYIQSFRITPDFAKKTFLVEAERTSPLPLTAKLYDGELLLSEGEGDTVLLDASACKPWSPDEPELYRLVLSCGKDEIESYAAMRSYSLVEKKGKKLLALNGVPIFQNGLLDQGYWKEGIYTPPSAKALLDELAAVKKLGFNMLRKHAKIEPMLYYHYCDCLGILVWQDMVNGGGAYPLRRIYLGPFVNLHLNDRNYRSMRRSEASRKQYMRELEETTSHLYNAPCICLWTPFNEGWGQFDAALVAKKVRSLDPTRLIDHASGWQDKGEGDLNSRHVYFRVRPLKGDKKRALALTEYGGYSYALKGHTFAEKKFGYKGYSSKEDLQKAYRTLLVRQVFPFLKEGLCATVYTQLTDVEEEINGLFTYDRLLKFDEKFLREINGELYEKFEEEYKNS